MKHIFLICPVRNATKEQKAAMAEYIERLEQNGYSVYYPARDTDQNDASGYRICYDNLGGIAESDEVHVFWDKNSSGSLFDLGMAFALHKQLVIANIDEVEHTKGKSFSEMIRTWAEKESL